jgi:hypothetical protein
MFHTIATIARRIAGFVATFGQSAPVAAVAPRQPYVMVTNWTFDAVVGYYDANGVCITRRRIANGDVCRIIAAAKARGYRYN